MDAYQISNDLRFAEANRLLTDFVQALQVYPELLSWFSRSTLSALRARGCQLPLYDYESLTHFVQQGIKTGGQKRLLRVDHYVGAWARHGAGQANGLAQAALHAIAVDGAPQNPTHGESDPKTGGCWNFSRASSLPVQVENSHRSREMPAPLLVHALEICVAQQPRAALKSRFRLARVYPLIRCFGHTGGHSASLTTERFSD